MADLRDLENIEEYLASLQRIEIMLRGDRSPAKAIISKYAKRAALYRDDPVVLEKMRSELVRMINDIVSSTAEKGAIMGEKAIMSFIEKSERRGIAKAQIRAIRNLGKRQAERRLDVYATQIEKEAAGLSYDIKIFLKEAGSSGIARKEAVARLLQASDGDTAILAGFEKRAQSIAVAAARREAQAAAMTKYAEAAKPNEKWEWITVSSKPCPDCRPRAGKVLTYDRWMALGLPGSGRTVCGAFCMCQLMPVSVSDELFPDAKELTFDKEKLVLTTASELRTLMSKGASGG